MEHWNGSQLDNTEALDNISSTTMGRMNAQMLAEFLIIELRHHGHFNNVLTHIFAADWGQAQASLERLLDWHDERLLTNREADLVSLLCGERGVTGKLMRPWMAGQLRGVVDEACAARLERTWSSWHNLRMILPVRFRKSAMPALRGE